MEEYEIYVESPLGTRQGKLNLTQNGAEIYGTIMILGTENSFTGQKEGDMLILRHQLETSLSKLNCESKITLTDDELTGSVYFQGGKMKVRGRKIKAQPLSIDARKDER